MRIGTRHLALVSSLATAGALSGCAVDELEGEDSVESTASSLVDTMGNSKQNRFGVASTPLASFCGATEICRVTDFSGDGRADLVAIDPAGRRVRFARNLGTGAAFTVTSQSVPSVRAGQAFDWGDVNRDGREDLFICDAVTGQASLLLMVTSATLDTAPRPVASGFCAAGDEFRVGDVDGDGGADALRFRMNAPGDARGDVLVAVGNGDLSFRAPASFHPSFGINTEQVRVADLDGNGKDDVVTCLPGGGVFVAMSNGTAFVSSRRPRVGVGPAAGRPLLTDFMAAGQTCLTGDFDGGGKADLAVFFGSVGGFIDDFNDTRGDVVVALSHTELDFTDAYRAGTPRIRHESFCQGGEICGVGDLDGDGKDDLVAFAHGTGGSTAVRTSRSLFGAPTTWNLDLFDILAHRTEGHADKPLVLALSFRSTVGVRGSTVITRNAYDESFAAGIVAGGPAIRIPAPVGRFTFSGVRLRTFDNLMNRERLEILGTVVVVMEKDLSAAAAYGGLLDEATRALTTVLVNHVESKNLIAFVTGGLDLSLSTLRNELGDHMFSAIDDLVHLYITGLFDPDDFINVNVAVFPALDKELVGVLPEPSSELVSLGVPGEGAFGRFLGTLDFQDGDSPLHYAIRAIFR